jgi:lysophospholipase L1-like esterase
MRKAGVYVAIVVTALLGAEVMARFWDWTPRARDVYLGDCLGSWRYEFATGGAGDLVPGQDGHWIIWFHRPYHVQTNRLGLRNTEEASDKAFRVLAVGDSQTFGPHLANEDTWPAWTENFLRQKLGGADRVQVFNAGIAGYTILEQLAYLKEKGVAFQPNVVVLAVFENDVLDLRREQTGFELRPTGKARSRFAAIMRTIRCNSAVASVSDLVAIRIRLLIAGVDVRRDVGKTFTEPRIPQDYDKLVNRYGELFRQAVALLKSHNIALAVIFIPDVRELRSGRASTMEPVIRALTSETRTPYLDLAPVLRGERDPEIRFYLVHKDIQSGQFFGNSHLSRAGNIAIGHLVADWLVKQKLVTQY